MQQKYQGYRELIDVLKSTCKVLNLDRNSHPTLNRDLDMYIGCRYDQKCLILADPEPNYIFWC